MENQYFEPDFQFEKYLNDRLLEIEDEGERRALKDVLRKTLLPFYDHARERYEQLESRLYQAQGIGERKFELITGIAERSRIDVTDNAMFPMDEKDLEDPVVDGEELLEKVRAGKPYPILRVFVEADYKTIKRLQNEKRSFRGRIYTEDGEYGSQVRLTANHSYLEKIADLYPAFEKNGIPWKTACIPYLGKFFDVEVLSTDCPSDETITKYKIDFEEYTAMIRFDIVPMWNVRLFNEKTGAYPDLAKDRVHYEHVIYRNRFAGNSDYLIAEKDIHLWNVFFQDGDMHIVCDDPNPRNWNILELNYRIRDMKWETPYFGNGMTDSQNRRIHTKAEIRSFFASMNCKDLELVDLELTESDAVKEKNTYSMDAFLEDEIRVGKGRETLLLKFRAVGEKNFLTYDIMSFLVSRLQWEIPEFLCVGELI